MPRRRYNNPPIDEALCELRFVPRSPWDLTLPGRMFEAVKDEYRGPARTVHQQQFHLAPRGAALAVNQSVAAVQLVDDTGTRVLTLGQNQLVVHALRPYPKDGWDEFRPRIQRALDAYAALVAPVGVSHLGVRYINRIELPEADPDLGRYFTSPPVRASGFPQRLRSFLQRSEHDYDDGARLITTFATLEAPPTKTSYLLDIDVVAESAEAWPMAESMARAEEMRNRERDAFEALITDHLRSLFDE